MSFTSGVFPSTRKFTSILLGHQKDSKLDYSNYLRISLLSSLDKILEKLMSITIFKFFNNNNFSTLCDLALGKIILQGML